jgi:hypothetical protein
MPSVIMLSIIYAECRNEVYYAECHYAKCRYGECRCARPFPVCTCLVDICRHFFLDAICLINLCGQCYKTFFDITALLSA